MNVPVKEEIARHARIPDLETYRRTYERSLADAEGFWREQSERLEWFEAPPSIHEYDPEAVDFSWYKGGVLNACYNCVDRHVAKHGEKTAIIWAKDAPGEYQRISYQQLEHEVCRVANVLKANGVEKGDRVAVYLPMIPELAYTMLACARIGAVHSVVFAGFSADALRDRIVDAGAKILVTANEGLRGGKTIPLKATSDRAVDGLSQVERVLVARRTDTEVPMRAGRDLWLADELAKQRATCPAERMDAEDPLFILYTSGSTGKPKGVLHTTGGYLVYASLTHELVFDLKPDDVYLCAADIGWITVGVNILYTAPTAIRAIARHGDGPVKKYSRKSLRILGTVGEPINPEVWMWYHDVVGDGRCAIVDTWWQTETGGILITPLPGAIAAKPGSATLPFFGVRPVIVDDDGERLEGNDVRGNLCLEGSWPGQARTIYGDHERFKATYFERFPGLYFTGDGCRRDEDGYYWITGRVDDVLNVSGHRLGTAEIESALVAHEAVAEAAVVGYPHEVKGTGIFAYVMLTPEASEWKPEELVGALKQQVREAISAIAVPDRIQVAGGLPKTRSGKIMRRILRKIAAGEYGDLGDTSTLADPSVVEALVDTHKAAG